MSITQKIGQKACDFEGIRRKASRKVIKAKQGSGYDLVSEKEGEDIRKIEVKAETGSQVMGKHAYALTLKE